MLRSLMVLCSLTLSLLAETPSAQIISPQQDWLFFKGLPITLVVAQEEGLSYHWSVSTGEELDGSFVSFLPSGTDPITVTMVATNAAGESSLPDDRIFYHYSTDRGRLAFIPKIEALNPSAWAVHPDTLMQVTARIADLDADMPYTYYWSWVENERIKRAVGETLAVRLPLPEGFSDSFTLSLIVADASGNHSFPATIQITVKEGNLPPTGFIVAPTGGRIDVLQGSEVPFKAEGSDPEGDPIIFRWFLPDGTQAEGDSVTYRFDEVGEYTVILNTRDNADNSDPISKLLAVSVHHPDNVPPPNASIHFPISATRIYQDEALHLTGTSSKGVPTWIITNEVSGEQRQLEGESPGRQNFPEAGLFRLRLRSEYLNTPSPETDANFKWISVWQRDDNQPPQLSIKGEWIHVLPNGSQLDLEVIGVDPEGQELTYFWMKDGVRFGDNGPKQSVTFQYAQEDFYQGYLTASVRVQVVDANGKPAIYPQSFLLYVYEDKQPPVAMVNTFNSAGTDFLALGDTYEINTEMFNPDNVALNYHWSATYPLDAAPFWRSEDQNPSGLVPPEKGLFYLSLTAESADGTIGAIPFLVYVQVYDPNLLPRTRITSPSHGPIHAEPGRRIDLQGFAIEPNYHPTPSNLSNIGEKVLGQVTNTLTWVVEGDNEYSESFTQNEALHLVLEEVGSYTVSLNTTNSLGFTNAEATQISLEVTEPPGEQGYEPNNTRETASSLNLGVYGSLLVGAEDALDWYRFNLEKDGELLELDLDLSESEDVIRLEVYREDTLLTEASLEPGKHTPFSFVGGDAGAYFLKLAAVEGSLKAKAGLSFSLDVNVRVPLLTFPHIRQDAAYETELTLVNPTGSTAEVVLIAHNAQGQALAEYSAQLPPGGHFAENIESLFPVHNALNFSWIQVLSDHGVLGLATTTARDGETAVAEWASNSGLEQLVVPHIAQETEQWYTQAAVTNLGNEPVDTLFSASAGDYSIPQLEPANGSAIIDFQAFFGGALPVGAEWGTFLEAGAQPSLSGIELFGTRQGSPRQAALRLSSENFKNPNFTYQNRNIYFPHVAQDIATFWTGIAFVNTAANVEPVRLVAYGSDGQELASEELVLEAHEKKVGQARSFFNELTPSSPVSWIKLETSGAVAGYELFGDNTGDDQRLAGFPAIRGGSREIYFLKILYQKDRFWTGIAAVNLSSSETADLTYEAYGADGTLLTTVTGRSIGPLRKEVLPVQTIFGGSLPEGLAWIKLEATQPLTAFQLFGDNAGKYMAGTTAQ